MLHISALGLLPVFSACGEAASLGASSPLGPEARAFRCATFNGPKASTYDEFFGINDREEIVGYAGGVGPYEFHPGKRYEIERFPGSVDSELTSLDNDGAVAGWYEAARGRIYGMTEWQGIWTKYSDPRAGGRAMRILGINDSNDVVGYYENRQGVEPSILLSRGEQVSHDIPFQYEFCRQRSKRPRTDRRLGDGASGATEGWLLEGKRFANLVYPGAVLTQPSGINKSDEIVGSFEDASGNTHGFILTQPLTAPHWQQFDEPHASGETVLAGINDRDDLVGYYKNGSGRIVALLCR